MNPKVIVIDTSKCTGCNDCINKCKELYGVSRIKKSGEIPVFCMQCENAPCYEICPVDAIYLEDGIPIVKKEKCIGCAMCEIACPVGSIFIENTYAHKCTLCLDSDRLTPACVEACKDNALKLICDECIQNIKDVKRKKLVNLLSDVWIEEI